MIDPILKDTKVIFGPCRLSYTHVFDKYSPDGDPSNGKYMTNVLIPKTEKKTIKAIETAIETARKIAITGKWGGKEPKKIDTPLHDGDEKENDDDEVYIDNYYLNAKCISRPNIVDKAKNPITNEEDIYSGVWAYVSVSFYGYYVSGKSGIACGLNNIMKFKDDDRLGGRVSADVDFADIPADDESDEDL